MASEIRVDKINSLSGVGTVTLSPTGVDISGITTAATLRATTGIITSLTAGSLTSLGAVSGTTGTFTSHVSLGDNDELRIGDGSDLKLKHDTNNSIISNATGELLIDSSIINLRDTSNNSRLRIEPAGNVRVDKNINVVGIATVGSAVTISESGIEASGIGITVANINGTQIGGRRNIIINGAMNVAQRGTSSTTSGYGSVDRFRVAFSGTDEAPTHAQVDVSSGTTPYTLGFRKALKVTNGNQTSGAGASDQMDINYRIEGQDMAGSGWNYISSNSKITLSFWVKSSVAQNFYGYIRSVSGTVRSHPYETGSLTADTWTKITKTFSGDSNITINNDNSVEFNFYLVLFHGTGLTASGVSLTAWNTYDITALMPDNTSTWYTTNDATLEITGVQLEVGDQATAFEHRSYGEELSLCHRYFQSTATQGYYLGTDTGSAEMGTECGNVFGNNGDDNASGLVWFGGIMRTAPTVTLYKRNSTTTGQVEQNGVGRTAAAAAISAKGCEYINITGGNATAAVPACCAYTCNAEL